MEYRKLIKFGGNSHVISLPSQWLTKHKLSKGDVVYVDSSSTDIIISPSLQKNKNEGTTISIEIKKGDSKRSVKRKIIGAYINDGAIIEIRGVNLKEYRKYIVETVQGLVALEIIEQSDKKYIAKCYINSDEVSVSSFIRKMDNNIRYINQDLISEIKSDNLFENYEIIDNIKEREENIDRLNFLIKRVIHHRLKEPPLKSRHMHDPETLMKWWDITQNIEQIGDTIEEISIIMVKSKISDLKGTVDLILILEDAYKNAMKSFYTNNSTLAFEASNRVEEINNMVDQMLQNETNVNKIIILEKTKNITKNITCISRLNYSIMETKI